MLEEPRDESKRIFLVISETWPSKVYFPCSYYFCSLGSMSIHRRKAFTYEEGWRFQLIL